MKFVNKTGEPKKIRMGKGPGGNYQWKIIQPDEIVDLSFRHGQAVGFEQVGKGQKRPQQDKPTDVETEDYKKKLLGIKGIGKKTVDDICEIYPTEESLKIALKNEEKIPIKDDQEVALRKKFK